MLLICRKESRGVILVLTDMFKWDWHFTYRDIEYTLEEVLDIRMGGLVPSTVLHPKTVIDSRVSEELNNRIAHREARHKHSVGVRVVKPENLYRFMGLKELSWFDPNLFRSVLSEDLLKWANAEESIATTPFELLKGGWHFKIRGLRIPWDHLPPLDEDEVKALLDCLPKDEVTVSEQNDPVATTLLLKELKELEECAGILKLSDSEKEKFLRMQAKKRYNLDI